MTEGTLTLDVRPVGGASILDVQGDITAASEQTLMDAYGQADANKAIVLNFSGLEYMNSGGIGLLVTLLVRANRQKQKLLAFGLTDHYKQIFELTRLDEAIGIHNTEARRRRRGRLAIREKEVVMSDQEEPKSRDEDHWAKPVSGLHVAHDLPEGAVNLNVEGRRVAAMAGGFGKMYQVTYSIKLSGADATPQDVVKVWKQNFARFWPKKSKFFGPLTDISPGDVALLNVKAGGVKLSTGILVLYADDESFSFMTPEGHMFNGMITFSSHTDQGITIAQVQGLIRAQDPMYELGMTFGGKGAEDRMWLHVLSSLAKHFGVDDRPTVERVVVDKRRQWSQWRNIKKNAAVRSGLHMATAPLRAMKKPFKKKSAA